MPSPLRKSTSQESHPPDDRRRRFEDVYAANRARILGYALRRTSDPQDAADVLAETFLTAWRRLDDVPPGDQARLWLYGVARRVLANHHRGERRRSALAADLGSRLRDGLAVQDPSGDGPTGVGAAFRGLPESDRELLALVGWEGLDHGEIATVLGCSRNAVRIRLHRARRRFARALASMDADAPAAPAPAASLRAASTPATSLHAASLPAKGRRIPNGDPT
ncbi:RNA polymerase sigma factor [Actinomadura citrea]|uniref:RNA polymerase sigma-70 factor (ECF subfamily) n=1 Tax=Actinomadura citrea TaxID=46158 RepID=A0A7Y9KES6_9ACTN|nr:RNA polymerase sigma factor [Actinomadura citrea]NYE16567.1 RNA polymerase sigma-70 factor (ECF subfamily) [Actinomadura citrea]